MLNTLLFLLGAACIIAAPVLNIFSFLLLLRMRRAIDCANPSGWHRPAPLELLTTHQSLTSNSAAIARLAVAYKVSRKAAVIALLGAVVTMFLALKNV